MLQRWKPRCRQTHHFSRLPGHPRHPGTALVTSTMTLTFQSCSSGLGCCILDFQVWAILQRICAKSGLMGLGRLTALGWRRPMGWTGLSRTPALDFLGSVPSYRLKAFPLLRSWCNRCPLSSWQTKTFAIDLDLIWKWWTWAHRHLHWSCCVVQLEQNAASRALFLSGIWHLGHRVQERMKSARGEPSRLRRWRVWGRSRPCWTHLVNTR